MQLTVFPDIARWVKAVADLWEERLRRNPSLRMCLAAGRTPLPIYHEMARRTASGRVTFRQSTIFALDEYGGLPLDSPARCANMIRFHLVDRVDLPLHCFHFPDTTASDLAAMCRHYEQAIDPGFDLAILGIGSNGHVGLNEPGSPPDSPTRKVRLHPESVQAASAYLAGETPPVWGVTLGLACLLASREVWLLACGAAKAGVVARVAMPPATSAIPASLFQNHANCQLLVDASAAGPWRNK